MKSDYLAPLLTLAVGFIPLVILSDMLGALWINSKYAFPFVLIPSVLIGDSIFLPIFNYKFYILLKNKIKYPNLLKSRVFLLIIATTSIGISYMVNYYVNISWVSDNYLGFMDITKGALSIAGIYHFWFSVIQMALIIMFIGIAILVYRNNDINGFIYAYNTWKIIVGFSSLTIMDFFVRQIFIYQTANLARAFISEFSSFTILVISSSLLVFGKYLITNMRG